MIRKIIVAAVCVAFISLVADQGLGQRNGQEYLFAQYYTQSGASSAHAEMYPAPHPVPAHVGNSYYTYQPLMPHEMMYSHSRNYYNFYANPSSFYCDMCGGHCNRSGYGLNKTSVRWQSGTNAVAPLPGTLFPFTKAQSLWNKHRYTVPRYAGPWDLSWLGLGSHGCKSGRCGGYESCGYTDSCDGYSDGAFEGCSDGGCSGCTANWSQARQHAVARAANKNTDRYTR